MKPWLRRKEKADRKIHTWSIFVIFGNDLHLSLERIVSPDPSPQIDKNKKFIPTPFSFPFFVSKNRPLLFHEAGWREREGRKTGQKEITRGRR